MPEKEEKSEAKVGPEPRPSWGVTEPPKLGPLPDHVELGEQIIDTETSCLIAAPFIANDTNGRLRVSVGLSQMSRPSPFRDQIGLDPDPMIDDTTQESIKLESPDETLLTPGMVPPAIRVRFRPTRAGRFDAVVTIAAIGIGNVVGDHRRIRVTGVGRPRIVDNLRKPDGDKAITDPTRTRVEPVGPADSLDTATARAMTQATALGERQRDGVDLARDDIKEYRQAPPAPAFLDQLIELAVMMGVSGIAGVVARYLGKHVASALARPVARDPGGIRTEAPFFPGKLPNPNLDVTPPKPSGDHLATLVTDSVKEGFKATAKIALKHDWNEQSGAHKGPLQPGQLSSNWLNEFVANHRASVSARATAYQETVTTLAQLLKDQDPESARAAMQAVAEVFNLSSAYATDIQARNTRLQWIAAVARRELGERETTWRDGSATKTTNLDPALSYGANTWYSESPVPKHRGVLDIHVDLPVGMTPVELSGFTVRSASITGVAQEVADWLPKTNLLHAGIPIRLVVHGHPALITRDEVGRVRINGYLLTKDGTQWTEAHMHKGATFLVERVLTKTLAAWGITDIETDDATGREPMR